jgi:hypothetical protein
MREHEGSVGKMTVEPQHQHGVLRVESSNLSAPTTLGIPFGGATAPGERP